ncbi:MAG: 2,3-bisphosphoglycerate-dependent phosphoglycerate mutase, partial [Actinomycetota bacterium]|nr:2,3-bisphosphoglycerate-dependent phosphoglycerate mutase [Actinomycetota bacterium]
MADLLIVRHGESEWNAAGRWQGWADPPLSPKGEDQATAAAVELAGLRLEAIAASDLQRARRTAEIITAELELGDVHVDVGLRERNVGDFSGLTRHEIEARWPGMLAEWRSGRAQQAPGGEGPEFLERVLAALDRVADRFAGQRVLVVAHGGLIRTVHRHLGGEP